MTLTDEQIRMVEVTAKRMGVSPELILRRAIVSYYGKFGQYAPKAEPDLSNVVPIKAWE